MVLVVLHLVLPLAVLQEVEWETQSIQVEMVELMVVIIQEVEVVERQA